jgi:hypothetical protein
MRIVSLVLISALPLVSVSCKTQTPALPPVVAHKGLIVATFLNPTMDEDAARAADTLVKVLKERGILTVWAGSVGVSLSVLAPERANEARGLVRNAIEDQHLRATVVYE